jgi:hypothetical protein
MMEHPVTQGSEAWLSLRLGHPTASEFDSLITPLGKIKTGDGPQTYLYRKIAEHVTGKPVDEPGSRAMENGSLLESEAIPFYEAVYDVKVRRVGYVSTDDMKIGCSPDGLVGDNEGLEIKCPLPHTHARHLLEGVLPAQYTAQVQGAMYVTGRPHWTFLSYNRFFPPLVVRVERDDKFQAALKAALTDFLAKMDEAMEKIRQIEGAPAP